MLLDKTALQFLEIEPKLRRKIRHDKLNLGFTPSQDELERSMQQIEAYLAAFRETGDQEELAKVQAIVDAMDTPLVVRYTPRGSNQEVPMMVLPPRLQDVPRDVLLQRLEV